MLHFSRCAGSEDMFAALGRKHELQQVMKNRDDQYCLERNILTDDAYWGGEQSDGQRDRGASGKMSFGAALSLSGNGYHLCMKFSQVQPSL